MYMSDSVGIAELRQNLSVYLRRVSRGERLVVTDRARPDRLFDRARSRFPHVLQVEHLPAGAQPAGGWQPSPVVERDPRELAGDFIAHVTGMAASPAELQLFSDAYEKALAAG